MSDTNFAAIGQLVTEARNLLDSIKGGAIRVMQTQFEALKQQFRDSINQTSVELATFINQQKANVDTIFTDPDNRYQRIAPLSVAIHGEKDKFYPVAIGGAHVNRLTEIHIGRFVHTDSPNAGAMYAKFTASVAGWGSRPGTLILEALKTTDSIETAIKTDGFLCDYAMPTEHPQGAIVWLRGGYTYDMWVDGGKLNRVISDETGEADIPHDAVVIFPNGYSRTLADISINLPIKTNRNTTTVPTFLNYEKV